jgi:uncharacterized protein
MEKEPLIASINVAQLLKEPVGSSQSYDISGVVGEEVEGSVEGRAKLTHINQGVLVQCKLTAEVRLICSRCLNTFLLPVSFAAEEEFVPVSDVPGDLVPSSPEQLEEFTIDDKHILDLSELIRQYTLLSLPMKPLCRPDCPGIN